MRLSTVLSLWTVVLFSQLATRAHVSNHCALACGRYTYLLQVELPARTPLVEPPLFIYQGDMLNAHDQVATITKTSCQCTFSLVITQSPTMQPGHTPAEAPRAVALRPHEPVRWFDLTLQLKQGCWEWKIQELTRQEMPSLLPDHAIVFLCDPALVAEIRPPKKSKYHFDTIAEGGCCTFAFPTIVIKGSPTEILDAAKRARCECVYLNQFHTHSPRRTQATEGCLCACIPLESLHENAWH